MSLDLIAATAGHAFSVPSLTALVFGVFVGLVVGPLPGVGGIFAMALLLPLTTDMDVYSAVALLVGIGSVTATSDVLPAVLFGVPGTVAAIATVEDGHPMTKRGEAGRALGASYSASMLGGVFGAIALGLTIPLLRPMVTSLRTSDFLAVSVFGLLFVGVISGKEPVKGVLMALFGVLVSMVGIDPFGGQERFTFHNMFLWDGLPITTVFMGLYGLSELGELLRRGSNVDAIYKTSIAKAGREVFAVGQGIRDTLDQWRLVLGSSAIGTFVGAIPGIGIVTIDWIAYGLAKRSRGGGPAFGEGNVRGVIAPESANNAKEGGNLIPTLVLGLPGSIGMVFILSVITEHGIAPGPKMLTDELPLVYTIVFFIAAANVLATSVCIGVAKPLARMSQVPVHYLVPIALVLVILGAFREHLSILDVVTLAVFGVLGTAMKHNGWSRPAFALGLILGPNVERFYFLSMQLTGSGWLFRPAVLIVISMILGGAFWLWFVKKVRPGELVLKPAAHTDVAMLVLLAIVGVYVLINASELRDGAGSFPAMTALAMLVLALPPLARWRQARYLPANMEAYRSLGIILMLIATFTVALFLLGPASAAMVFVFGFASLGNRRITATAGIAAIGTALGSFVLFEVIQHVSWPVPMIVELWMRMNGSVA